jgi:signal transduction histidine kinase
MRAWVLTDSQGVRLVVEETELIEPRSFTEERIEQLDSELAKLITDVVHVQSKWDETPDFSHLRLSNPYLRTPHVRTKALHCDCPIRRTEQSERCWELPPGSADEPRTLSLTAQQLFGHCDHCDVFKCATPDPLTRLAENINRLVSLLEYDHQEMLHAQQEVLQADKRFLVGELVLGLAHEIKTPLSVIIGRLDCLKMELDSISPAELAADLNVLQEHAWRMRGVLESVFNMARPAAPKFRITRPADEIARMLSLLRKTLEQAELEVKWSCAEDADEIYADPEQLQQVLLNLMLNARDAMPGGGSLTLTVYRQRGERSGVVISIRDTGEGIAPDQINRIFSPFFSTKTNHGGTGLGLAVCQRIMIQHGGLISVESRLGEGATFSLWFPESREVAAAS